MKAERNSLQRRDWLALLTVLVVAAVMRLGQPGILEYRHDEALLSLTTQDMLSGKGIPLVGIPSSVGLPNSPISVYILAIPYALSNSPQVATLFIAALNVIGVGLLWLIARRYFGRVEALVAGLAYAVNPWAVLYSRKIWAQDYHTPLILLAILLGLLGFVERKRWAHIACLPILLIAVQIHFAALALVPIYVWFLWIGRRNLSIKALATSLFLGVLTLTPFWFGLSQTLAQHPDRLTNAVHPQVGGIILSSSAIQYMASFATGLGLETQVAPDQGADLLANVPPAAAMWWLIGAVVLVGIVGAIVRHRRLAPLLVLWAGLPILIFTPTWTRVFPHYFIASLPPLYLLAGIGAAYVIDWLPEKRILTGLVLAALGVIFLTQGVWWFSLLRYLDTADTPNGFGTPMHHLLDVRAGVANVDDIVVISNGFDVLLDQEAAIWPTMLWRNAGCVRTLAGQGGAVIPSGAFAAITAPDAPENALDNRYRRSDETRFDLRPGEGAYDVSFFPQGLQWTGTPLADIPPALFANGAQLTGYHLDSHTLYLRWLLPGPVDTDYHYFGHFLNANGDKLGQTDNSLWPGRFWCKGDQLITWADINLPPDTTTLRVGLYRLNNGQFVNNPVIDSAGNPVSSWVDIPLPKSP